MTENGQQSEGRDQATDAPGGWRRYRNLLYAAATFGVLAAVFGGAIVLGGPDEADTEPATYAPPTVAGVRTEPALTASALPRTDAPSTTPAGLGTPTGLPDPNDPTATSTVGSTPDPTGGLTATATPTLTDAWSATPSASTPGPTTGLSPAAAAIALQIEAQWGIDVVTEGQNWGANDAQQQANLRALAEALESLPAGVAALATHNDHGALAVLSNNAGRTLSGWQPYGSGAANFYATEDFGPTGRVETSQIVLQPGSSRMTITHELMHAYQMRDVLPGRYGEALLTPEMTSFMAATGWVPNVPPDVLEASLGGSWGTINAMFDYTGPELVYTSETGETVHAHTPNPVEAFAVVAALYYAAPGGTPLPDWPDYWAWYDANLN